MARSRSKNSSAFGWGRAKGMEVAITNTWRERRDHASNATISSSHLDRWSLIEFCSEACQWRRRRDSNPRYALTAYNGLASARGTRVFNNLELSNCQKDSCLLLILNEFRCSPHPTSLVQSLVHSWGTRAHFPAVGAIVASLRKRTKAVWRS